MLLLYMYMYIGQPFLDFLAGGAVASLEAGDWPEEVAAVSFPLGATKIRYHYGNIICSAVYVLRLYRTTFLGLLFRGSSGFTRSRKRAGRGASSRRTVWDTLHWLSKL